MATEEVKEKCRCSNWTFCRDLPDCRFPQYNRPTSEQTSEVVVFISEPSSDGDWMTLRRMVIA